MTEYEMQMDCYNRLKESGRYKHVVLEVPFCSRCIDMVLITHKDEIVTIEFKLRNWKHAIYQAKDHNLGADSAYIAMPEKAIKNIATALCKKAGIGVFSYHKTGFPLQEVFLPRTDIKKWDMMRKSLWTITHKILDLNDVR